MSEQDQTESKDGIGASGVVGGVIGGGAVLAGADRILGNKAILNNITGEKVDAKIAENAQKAINGALEKDAKLGEKATLATRMEKLEKLHEAEKTGIKSVQFSEVKDGAHTATLKAGRKSVTTEGIQKLPEGEKIGKTLILTGENAQKYVKDAIASENKALASALRSSAGIGTGLKLTSGLGKAGIAVATLAGIGVGAKAAHAIFGGKHTDQVATDRAATPDQAAAR